jgi:hypothetical protein
MEVFVGRALNPGATLTTVTNGTGNTNIVRDFSDPSGAYLEELWAQGATAGEVRITSPRLHDNVQGLRFQTPAAVIRSYFPDEVRQRLYANDPLAIQISGGGAETDVVAALFTYDELSGIQQNLQTWAAVQPRIIDYVGQVVQVAGPTVAGDWSAGTALNSFSQQLKADASYAILGYVCATPEAAVGISGSDTGNLKVGGPGPTEPLETRDWFVTLSVNTGKPLIPIIKANNQGGTFVSIARATTGGTDNVSLLLARLSA